MKKIDCEEYAIYLSNPKSIEAKNNLIGRAYMDLSAKIMTEHPDFDEDTIRDLAFETVTSFVKDEGYLINYPYGTLLAHAKQNVLTRYERLKKKSIEIVPLSQAKNEVDSTSCMVEECTDRLIYQDIMKLIMNRLNGMSKRRQELMYLRFLSNNGDGMEFDEIADICGVSGSRVRDIVDQTLKLLRVQELTEKENKILAMISSGMTVRFVAKKLKIQDVGVERKLENIEKIQTNKKIKELYDLI